MKDRSWIVEMEEEGGYRSGGTKMCAFEGLYEVIARERCRVLGKVVTEREQVTDDAHS